MAKATDALEGGIEASDKELARAFEGEIPEFKGIKIGIMIAAIRAARTRFEKKERRKAFHQEKWTIALEVVKAEPKKNFEMFPLFYKGERISSEMIDAARRHIKQKNLRTTVRNFYPQDGKPGVGPNCRHKTGKTVRKRAAKVAKREAKAIFS
ncbi:MAG: hypothetical protein GWO87_01720 [Xanthomonadaceae bacterium]|nr:hypothetical protein [Rhodospirillaceae bacterium]NIA17889.1 hypothetical protein [Xanthomonadaceae bacterium]